MVIKILVATHKISWMPEDEVYIPIQIGRALNYSLNMIGDNTGENISYKQPYYAELTAIYWAWKNLNADYVGLNHYRRYFVKKVKFFSNSEKFKYILKYDDFKNLLNDYPVLLPKKRNYWIVSKYYQYKKSHNISDLELCREIIEKLYPDYLIYFDKSMRKKKGHICNMFIMKRELFNEYCQWLFSILFEMEKRIDISTYTGYQMRVFGYIAERLLDVWIDRNNIKYKELNYLNIEGNNWVRKIASFIYRIFIKK